MDIDFDEIIRRFARLHPRWSAPVCVGDSFNCELTMVTDGLPRSYLIQQCRTELNKVCHIDCLPWSQPGAKVHAVKDVIKEYVAEYLQETPNTTKLQIKINGDGARMTRNSTFVRLSFSILQTGEQVMTAKGNRTIAILNGKGDYISLKQAFGNIFNEINNLIAEAKITVNGKKLETEFFPDTGKAFLTFVRFCISQFFSILYFFNIFKSFKCLLFSYNSILINC